MDGKVKAYQTTDTLGKSQIDLVIKVYDGAIAAFRQTQTFFNEDKIDEGRNELEKAKKFVTHLYTTLDMDKGGEIADQLSQLYAYVINQTYVIEATKDLKLIDDNIEVLNNLRQGWIDLKEQQNQSSVQPSQNEQPKKAETFTTSA